MGVYHTEITTIEKPTVDRFIELIDQLNNDIMHQNTRDKSSRILHLFFFSGRAEKDQNGRLELVLSDNERFDIEQWLKVWTKTKNFFTFNFIQSYREPDAGD